MGNVMIPALMCALTLFGCDKVDSRAFERLVADALAAVPSADASIIDDQFVLVQELGVVLPRPQGGQWRISKSVDRSSGRPIASVEFLHTVANGGFTVIVSEGDPDDARKQARALHASLLETCTSPPRSLLNEGFDTIEIWFACPVVPTAADGTVGTPRVMKAVASAKQRLPNRVFAVIGLWQPENEVEMMDAVLDVIRKAASLTDA